MKRASAEFCSREAAVVVAAAAVVAAAPPEGAVAAEVARAAEPAAAASAVVVVALAGSACHCRWHARAAAHHGAAAAGARRRRSLTDIDRSQFHWPGSQTTRPISIVVPTFTSSGLGLPIASEYVPTHARTSGGARHKRGRPGVCRAPTTGHDGNRISVPPR